VPPAAPWACPGTGSGERERTWLRRDKRQEKPRKEKKRQTHRQRGMKELDLRFFKLAPLSSFPRHGPLDPSSTACWGKGHTENDSPLRARLPTPGF